MKLSKMITGGHKGIWPNDIGCAHCGRKILPREAVLAGRTNLQGTIVFHKGCIFKVVQSEWPESLFEQTKRSIIQNPEQAVFNQKESTSV